MIALDRGALLADFIRFYKLNYRELDVNTAATLAVNLPLDSQIKIKASGLKVPPDTLLLGAILDGIKNILYAHSKAGTPRPKSIVETMTTESQTESREDLQIFESPEDFKKAREALINGDRIGTGICADHPDN